MYKLVAKKPHVFLVHMDGPFHKNKDIWFLPSGMQEENETFIDTAKREFEEETNIKPLSKNFLDLGFVDYNSKRVYAWAFEGDLPDQYVFACNLTPFGWPENDKAEFFDLETAKAKIYPSQLDFLTKLEKML